MLKNMKILTKFNLLIVGMVLGVTTLLLFITFTEVRNGIENFATEKARTDLHLTYEYVNEKFDGDWNVVNGDLYKGSHRVNEDYELADELAEMTGGLITIFHERQPITTNLIINDERAVSVEATGEVTRLVLEEGQEYFGSADILGVDLQTAYRPILNENNEILGMWFVATSQEAISTTMSEIFNRVIITLMVVLSLTVGALLLLTKRIKRRVSRIIESVKEAGEGDLSNHYEEKNNDELGEISQSFNDMKQNLRVLMSQVTSASEQLASSSEQLTATSDQSAKASEEVAKTIEEISRSASDQAQDTEKGRESINELSSVVESNRENSVHLSKISDEITDLKDNGLTLMQDLIEKTNSNNHSAEEVEGIIQETNDNADKIVNASGMIQNISEQTNLLALNASIEAARAGEAGKGFAVVADEIRKLAEQSNQFSEEITSIIELLKGKTEEAVQVMKNSKKIASIQSDSVNKTTETFEGIANSIDRMQGTITDLNMSGEAVKERKEEMVQIIESLSAISQENAASTEEMSAAMEEQTASVEEIANSSDSLARLAEELQKSVRKFKY
ncbi:methyl-accepting chemotaxis protein [Bacillus shivajii]|uniref:methyl-accepting chemotaxis protein n=1 Tax=Bacillus shivajii TaxID=1983719 RepID=UPI001CF9F18B|nr:methyl-accepting chemotaxis protein [Bacillus shivajii]UCZ52056.1 methyl-accepting chemotaxis protein [Bacillus shivajii]